MEEIAFTTRGSSSTRMEAIECYRQSEYLCDVVIISEDGQRFPAHRLVLASASQFFDRMFRGSFVESKKTDVTIQNVDGALIKMLIDYAYKGEAICPAAVENVLSLYEASHYVQFAALFSMCSTWLKDHVNASNCLSMAMIADRHDDSDLRRVADCISAVNISLLSESEAFLCLSVEQLSRIIAQDDLGVKSEDDVLTVVQKWVMHDEVPRRDHVRSLSKFIRFPLIDFEETNDVLSDLDLVSSYHSSDGSYQHRVGCDGVLLIAGGVQRNVVRENKERYAMSRQARIYNSNSDTWYAFPSLAVGTSMHRIATSGGVLYSLGGDYECDFHQFWETYYPTKVVQRYDDERRQWLDDVEPMSCPRRGNEIVSCDSYIYGMSLEERPEGAMCEVFDQETKRWIAVSSPAKSLTRDYILSALDNNKVFAIGSSLDEQLGYMKYDTVEDRWCESNMTFSFSPDFFSDSFWASALVQPSSCYFASTGDRIYVHNNRKCAMIFDSVNAFSFVKDFFPFTSCSGLAYDVDSKRMYMFGDNQVAIYEERASKWDLRPFDGEFLRKFSCAVVDRKLMNFV